MKIEIETAPVLQPVDLATLKLHLRLDSGSFADNITETQAISPGSHAVSADYTLLELLTLDVAPGGAGWSVGDTISGVTSGETSEIIEVLTTKTYTVWERTSNYDLDEILTNGADTADQGAAFPTVDGMGIDVLGTDAIVVLNSGISELTSTVDVKIQESDDDITYTDWATGAFNQVTPATDNAIQEKAYTGVKQYIRTVALVENASADFSTMVIERAATTIEDDLLEDDIKTAIEDVEDITRRALLTQTWNYFLDEWPKGNRIKLPFGNLQTTSLAVSYDYVDTDGTKATTTMTITTEYLIETNGEGPGFIVLPYGVTWPTFTKWPVNPIKIQFRSGWTTAALVPVKIKQAILRICSMLYESRGEDVIGQTVTEDKTVMRLLASKRLWDNFL